MYGGIPCMLAASVPVLLALGLPFWAYWDSAVFCIFPSMAFGRIGCLLNGCCAGRPSASSGSVRLPDIRGEWARRVPVQLLECATAIAVLAGCALARSSLAHPGMLFLVAAAGYATARIPLQRFRDQRDIRRGLDVQTVVSVAVIVLALSGLAVV